LLMLGKNLAISETGHPATEKRCRRKMHPGVVRHRENKIKKKIKRNKKKNRKTQNGGKRPHHGNTPVGRVRGLEKKNQRAVCPATILGRKLGRGQKKLLPGWEKMVPPTQKWGGR